MARTQGHGNPAWTREETILALELYLDAGGNPPSPKDPRAIALSQLLRSLPYHREAAKQPTFRNPDGVGFKLMNIRQIATGKGLANVSRTDREIWDEFGGKPSDVRQICNSIRAAIQGNFLDEVIKPDEEFREGRLLTTLHRIRERDPKIRAKLLQARGEIGLRCEICDLQRPTLPKGLQESLFEAHHLMPLAETGERTTKISDLALLCACCHRLIHRAITTNKMWLGVGDVRQLLAKHTDNSPPME